MVIQISTPRPVRMVLASPVLLFGLILAQDALADVQPDERSCIVEGDALSCFDAGYAYANGDGVEKDESYAAGLFLKACDGGSQDGCLWAGYSFDEHSYDGETPGSTTRLRCVFT